MKESRLTNQRNGERLGVAVKFLPETRGVGSDEALREVMSSDIGPNGKAYDEELAGIAGKIKNMKPESAEECNELVRLEHEYGDIGAKKIDLVVKNITGQDEAVDK